ncbi:hypothetical protein BJX65DRAFT_291005 [Aspergillus insuetus]
MAQCVGTHPGIMFTMPVLALAIAIGIQGASGSPKSNSFLGKHRDTCLVERSKGGFRRKLSLMISMLG